MKAYPLERKTASMKQFMRQPIFDNRSKVFKDIICCGFHMVVRIILSKIIRSNFS